MPAPDTISSLGESVLDPSTLFPVSDPLGEFSAAFVTRQTTLARLAAALWVGSGTLASRPAAGVRGRLYFVTDAATPHLTLDNGAAWLESPITGTYEATQDGGPVTLLDIGSTRIAATVEGGRKSILSLYSTNPESTNGCALRVDNIHNPGSLTSFIRTGIDIRSFTAPDNGGESSGILSVSTGGGPAATFYSAPLLRPSGFPNYSNTPQPTVEIATGGGNAAILATSGATIGGAATGRGAAINVQVDGGVLNCDGIVIQPGEPDGMGFDARNALVIGNRQTNAAPVNVKAYMHLDGDTLLQRLGLGGSTPGEVVAGQATVLSATGYCSLDGVRVKGNDAANTLFQNNLNATLAITTNGGNVVLGAGVGAAHLSIIAVSGNVGIGTQSFGTNAAGVLAIKNGTAPTTGPADTVQLYSSDNSAGNTLLSWFCEGAETLLTGQADSASATRVRVRVNGTVVTLLAV